MYFQATLSKKILIGVPGSAFYIWNHFHKEHVEILCQKTKFNKKIVKKIEPTCKNYMPSLHVSHSPMLQMMYGLYAGIQGDVKYVRELLELPDKGVVSLDTSYPKKYMKKLKKGYDLSKINDMKIIVISHGLTGGSDADYVKDFVHAAVKKGYLAIVINNRGVGQTKLMTPKIHDYSSTEDFNYAVQYIVKKYPNAKLFGVGFSIGANLMVKYSGEQGVKLPFECVCSVSNPWDLKRAAELINNKLFGVLDMYLLNGFLTLIDQNKEAFLESKGIDIYKVLNAKTTKEFDNEFSIKLLGYSSVEEYYVKVSSAHDIGGIKKPVLCLNSLDDPISMPEAIPKSDLLNNENVTLVLTSKGGHVEFFTGFKPKRWYPTLLLKYINACDKVMEKQKKERNELEEVVNLISV